MAMTRTCPKSQRGDVTVYKERKWNTKERYITGYEISTRPAPVAGQKSFGRVSFACHPPGCEFPKIIMILLVKLNY